MNRTQCKHVTFIVKCYARQYIITRLRQIGYEFNPRIDSTYYLIGYPYNCHKIFYSFREFWRYCRFQIINPVAQATDRLSNTIALIKPLIQEVIEQFVYWY